MLGRLIALWRLQRGQQLRRRQVSYAGQLLVSHGCIQQLPTALIGEHISSCSNCSIVCGLHLADPACWSTLESVLCSSLGLASQQPPQAGGDVRSRGKRMAVKFLNKMGTKDRFNRPEATAEAGRQKQRKPAYSPEAFENLGAKGKQLASR